MILNTNSPAQQKTRGALHVWQNPGGKGLRATEGQKSGEAERGTMKNSLDGDQFTDPGWGVGHTLNSKVLLQTERSATG